MVLVTSCASVIVTLKRSVAGRPRNPSHHRNQTSERRRRATDRCSGISCFLRRGTVRYGRVRRAGPRLSIPQDMINPLDAAEHGARRSHGDLAQRVVWNERTVKAARTKSNRDPDRIRRDGHGECRRSGPADS